MQAVNRHYRRRPGGKLHRPARATWCSSKHSRRTASPYNWAVRRVRSRGSDNACAAHTDLENGSALPTGRNCKASATACRVRQSSGPHHRRTRQVRAGYRPDGRTRHGNPPKRRRRVLGRTNRIRSMPKRQWRWPASNAVQTSALHQSLAHEQERSGSGWMLEWVTLPLMVTGAGSS